MRLYFPVLGLILFFCLSFSCEKQQPEEQSKQLTYEDFRDFLTKDTNYQAIVAKFGEPDRDAGSGIHIYVYDLKDSTEIWIGYVDKILYARHMDKNRNVLHTII
jgi:hypothetical protein